LPEHAETHQLAAKRQTHVSPAPPRPLTLFLFPVQLRALQVLAENVSAIRDEIIATLQGRLDVFEDTLTGLNTTTNAGLEAVTATIRNDFADYCGRHCFAGEFVSKGCSTDGQRTECQKCPASTWSVDGLQRQCTNCTECASTQFTSAPCDPAKDTICVDCAVCDKGSWSGNLPCKDDGQKHCADHKKCKAVGKEWLVSAGTADADTVCKECATCVKEKTWAKETCAADADTVCASCTECNPDTHVVDSKCTETKDTVCKEFAFGGW